IGACLTSGLIAGAAALATAAPSQGITVQEAMLRAKPAVVRVISELATEVTLNCGSGPTTVTPPPFQETGTGWFADSRGWVVTTGRVVEPAYEPPKWLVNQQAQGAVSMACLPAVLKRRGIASGEKPEVEDALKRKLLDAVLPTTRVKLNPQVTVIISSGTKLKAEVRKYTPPVSNEPG